jgi:hypothetical protein
MARYQLFKADGTPLGEAETAQLTADQAASYIEASERTAYSIDARPGSAYPVTVYCADLAFMSGRAWIGCPYPSLQSAGYPQKVAP